MAAPSTPHPPSTAHPHVHPALPHLDGTQWIRLITLVVLPLVVWAFYALTHDRVSQRAGDLTFDIVVNHLTQTACIDFLDQPVPETLAEFSCANN